MSKSQNGFDAITSYSSLMLHRWNVPLDEPGERLVLPLRRGSAGFLLVYAASVFDKRVEDVYQRLLDDWGYAYRAVRGYSTTLSNHSSGTAIDLNATKYPLGTDNMDAATEQKIRKIVNGSRFKGTLRWGGDYRGRKDQMHIEVNADLAACERVARQLANTGRGKHILAANPGQRKVIFS